MITQEFAYVGGEFFVNLLIYRKLLATGFAQNANHFQGIALEGEMALNSKPS